MALALYRKYRPAKFAEVVGQEHVTEPLRIALEAGRINHAYLFSGPRGCGKTSSARILARSLNCEQGPTPDPCGVCASCVALAPEGPGNIDVVELDAASHGGVDDTRELRDRAFYAPAESRYRVFIVDEAHMVTTQGFNALLKIVEEPPEHLVFVFATTEPEKVLSTIRSRTHHYPFRLIPPGTLRGLLERICAEEGAVVAPAVFPLVIRAGGGSARDSLSVLDQLLAGAGPEGVTYERAVALLGVTDVALIDDVVDALAAGDRAAVFETVDRLVEAGQDPRRFAADLLQRLRDLTLVQAVPDAAQRGLVDVGADEVERMVEQADRLGPATLVRYGEILHAGLIEMRGATAPRLLLELLCARMLLPAASTGEPALLERLERIERRASIAPAPVPHGESAAAPPPGPDATQSGAARRTFVRSGRAGSEPSPEGRMTRVPRPGPTDVAGATGSPRPDEPADAAATDRAAADPVERPEPVRAAVGEAPNGAAVNGSERAEATRPRADSKAPTSRRRQPRRSRRPGARAHRRQPAPQPLANRADLARRRRRPAGLVGDPRRRQAAQPQHRSADGQRDRSRRRRRRPRAHDRLRAARPPPVGAAQHRRHRRRPARRARRALAGALRPRRRRTAPARDLRQAVPPLRRSGRPVPRRRALLPLAVRPLTTVSRSRRSRRTRRPRRRTRRR